jgi:hypothetical protein
MLTNMKILGLALPLFALLLVACQTPTSSDSKPNAPSPNEKVNLDVTVADSNGNAYANGRLADLSNNLKKTATMTVDATSLALQATYVGYFASLPATWKPGSSHTVSIQTALGGSFTTAVSVPSGSLTGLSYSPLKSSTFAASYTVSPPTGGWPTGSFVACSYTQGGTNYELDYSPTGTSNLVVPGSSYPTIDLSSSTALTFKASLRNSYSVTDFGVGSAITVSGLATSW